MVSYDHYPFSNENLIGIFPLEAGKIALSPPSQGQYERRTEELDIRRCY